MILLVLVNEFSHYVRRKNDCYTNIFGVDFIYGLTLGEAEAIYNPNNWNQIDFFKNYFQNSNGREVVSFMKPYSSFDNCIERFT